MLDDQGEVVLKNGQDSRHLLSKKAVNYMNYCLDSAVDQGTGKAADLDGMAVAGKTGTTSGKKDRYFAGFTGYYTAAVWCGYDTPEQIQLTGDKTNPAARLWKKVMQKLHKGKASIPLYSTEGMEKVAVCLDSGLLATDSCYQDLRTADGLSRVEQVWIYPEDKPAGRCTAHIRVDYCADGHGVANEYCQRFASAGQLKLETKALLKMTKENISNLLQAEGKGLASAYLRSDYVYLVNKNGTDADYFGLYGDVNQGLHLPYQVCKVHTKEGWEQYQASIQPPATEPESTAGPTQSEPPLPTLFPLPTEPPEQTTHTDE